MKTFATLALAAVAADAAAVRGFGPSNCVSLSRSSAGTCVVSTKCGEQDLSSFDISFECVTESGRQMHSLGAGSSDSEEVYDTDIKCQECLPPPSKAPAAQAGVSLAAISVSREVAKVHEKPAKVSEEAPPKAEWYGPEECVGVWRDEKSGTCVMQTDCDKDTQLDVYEFGLICNDKGLTKDEMTRHLFGTGSFAHKETFSTLIKCDECLALDEYMDGNKGVAVLTKMVKGMKEDLKGVSSSVVKLSAEVFPKQGAPGPAPAAAAPAPATAKPVKFLVAANEAAPQAPQQVAMKVEASKETNSQDASLGKDVTSVAEDGHEVQHVKKKASQMEDAPVEDILAAAVKGAQARGLQVKAVPFAVLDKAHYKSQTQVASPQVKQAQEQQVAPTSQQSQEAPERIEYVEDTTPAKDNDDDEDGDRDDAWDGD
jgi:hypothetical protein